MTATTESIAGRSTRQQPADASLTRRPWARADAVAGSPGSEGLAMQRHPSIALLKMASVGVVLTSLVGCASTISPVVYPSSKETVRQSASNDLAACRAQADRAVGINGAKSPRTGQRVAQQGAVEFVDKAVESLVNGSRQVWSRARGAGAGAMAGSITSVALNWNEPDAVYRNYVEHCLKERGHRVLGWR